MKDHGPGVKIPPPLIFLFFGYLGYLLETYMFEAPKLIKMPWPFGGACILLGLLVVVYAKLLFIRHKTKIEPWRPTTTIVQTGIFAYSRNPIYLAFCLMTFGVGLVLGRYFIIASIVPALFFVRYYVIKKEEAYLEKRFGDDYLAYKNKVRRWL